MLAAIAPAYPERQASTQTVSTSSLTLATVANTTSSPWQSAWCIINKTLTKRREKEGVCKKTAMLSSTKHRRTPARNSHMLLPNKTRVATLNDAERAGVTHRLRRAKLCGRQLVLCSVKGQLRVCEALLQ